MPVAMISTSTSPAFGPSRSSSTISSGCFAAKATAARVFMGAIPSSGDSAFLYGIRAPDPSRFVWKGPRPWRPPSRGPCPSAGAAGAHLADELPDRHGEKRLLHVLPFLHPVIQPGGAGHHVRR